MNKNVALIGDFVCSGNCSIKSQIPIISAFGDIPSIAFDSWLTNSPNFNQKEKFNNYLGLQKTFEMWEKNNIYFDALITGYIDNANDIKLIKNFIENNKIEKNPCLAIIDPTFADNGELYCSINDEHINNYKELIKISDIMTPNLTEACYLAGENYEDYKNKYCNAEYDEKNKEKTEELSKKIIQSTFPLIDKLRPKKNQITIITGIELYNAIVTILDIFDGDHEQRTTTCNFSPKIDDRNGTGDVFNAIFFELSTSGFAIQDALSISTIFINNALRYDRDFKIDKNCGLVYEPILSENIISIKNNLKEIKEKKDAGH